MFKKILFPTDFSDVSQKARDFIKGLKAEGGKEVIIIHVVDQRSFMALEQYASGYSPQLERELMAEAQRELDAVADGLKRAGLGVKTRLEIGIPLREILRAEEEEDVSIIVLGSHGKSNLEEVLLGSVSEKVLRKCKKPVLIVKR